MIEEEICEGASFRRFVDRASDTHQMAFKCRRMHYGHDLAKGFYPLLRVDPLRFECLTGAPEEVRRKFTWRMSWWEGKEDAF